MYSQNVYFLRIGIAEKKQDRITKKNGYYHLIFYGNCIKIDMVLKCAADFQKVYFIERDKGKIMPKDTVWHMIGHLQTNKVRQVIDKVALIHSVDNIKLAQVIQSEAEKKGRICNVLLEVNIAEENSKYGLSPSEVEKFAREIAGFDRIRVCGLMTVAPFTENPEENREYFRQMKRLAVDISAKNIDNVSMKVLSMGMTGDYEVAVEEGATMVRIGTGIFGEREYNIKE